MNIEIRKLTPALLDDYLYFFETEAHADNPDEDRCYCVCWCSADHRIHTDFSSPEKRRDLAIQYINNGAIQGYLAYYNGEVVGWCNANTKADCLNCTSWLRFMTAIESTDSSQEVKIKSIFCFTIAPNMKRKGIASQLLERVCKDAADDGFDFVEVYPPIRVKNEIFNHAGSTELYQKNGFFIYQEVHDKYKGKYDIDLYVMRKSLK